MKKILAILLAVALLLSLTACGGGEEDPNAGKYLGASAKALGMSMAMSDIYPGETWVELKSDGKGTIMLDGDDFSMKWKLEDETITVTIQGTESVGSLKDGVLVIDLMDMGVEMTFVKEGGSIADKIAAMATYNDAGYWEVIRIESEDPDSSVSEENMALAKAYGVLMYMELNEDGTGIMFMDEEMPLTWQDGTVTFTEDALSVSYTVENGELILDMAGSVLVLRKGEKPEPVVAEMEAAGFTEFMELGEVYPYTTICYEDPTKTTTSEATVTSYEIFESAEGYEAKEGYEWRVVKMDARFFDDNAQQYGFSCQTNFDDYYNCKLHDDSFVAIEDTENTYSGTYTVIHQGQEMEAYIKYSVDTSKWTEYEDDMWEIYYYYQWAHLVPVGYDGCVVALRNAGVEMADGTYTIDYDPDSFLLFRLN